MAPVRGSHLLSELDLRLSVGFGASVSPSYKLAVFSWAPIWEIRRYLVLPWEGGDIREGLLEARALSALMWGVLKGRKMQWGTFGNWENLVSHGQSPAPWPAPSYYLCLLYTHIGRKPVQARNCCLSHSQPSFPGPCLLSLLARCRALMRTCPE